MHNKIFQDELRKYKEDATPTESNPHKAFVERLKKQVSSDEASSNTEKTDSSDDSVYLEESAKDTEASFDNLFADFDDDD